MLINNDDAVPVSTLDWIAYGLMQCLIACISLILGGQLVFGLFDNLLMMIVFGIVPFFIVWALMFTAFSYVAKGLYSMFGRSWTPVALVTFVGLAIAAAFGI